MILELEQLETEVNELRDKLLEIKESVERLSYLYDSGSFYPDGERAMNELRELIDTIED